MIDSIDSLNGDKSIIFREGNKSFSEENILKIILPIFAVILFFLDRSVGEAELYHQRKLNLQVIKKGRLRIIKYNFTIASQMNFYWHEMMFENIIYLYHQHSNNNNYHPSIILMHVDEYDKMKKRKNFHHCCREGERVREWEKKEVNRFILYNLFLSKRFSLVLAVLWWWWRRKKKEPSINK